MERGRKEGRKEGRKDGKKDVRTSKIIRRKEIKVRERINNTKNRKTTEKPTKNQRTNSWERSMN
jgi:hypothetical protein